MTRSGDGLSRHVRVVGSFDELISARFGGQINALCWPRKLPGDFCEVAGKLDTGEGMTTVGDDDLLALSLGGEGAVARDVLLADQALLRERGLDPILDCIVGYPRDEAAGPIATDVYSFHADSATVEADTWLCTYIGACSEGIGNDDVMRRVEVAETRARLLGHYGGRDDEGFAAYLSANCFDLHYCPLPGRKPYSFGIGNLWRIAIAYPGSPVRPCIHRAPRTPPGAPARLLMIS